MPRPTDPDATENAFRMTTEEVEAWLAEGNELRATVRERQAAKGRDGEEERAA